MDFRILELPGTVATRYCGRLFAQFGAEVVMAGDPGDHRDGTIGCGGAAGEAYGRWLDAGKIPGPGAGQFDLVIAWETNGARDDATVLNLAWFDRSGPYADWPATDETINALAGVAYSFGEPEGPPILPQGHAPSIIAGATAFNAGLAALLAVPDRRPRRVDVNVFEATMCLSEVGAIAAIDNERARSLRLGVNRFSPTYPCTSYRTTDGWVGVTCLTPAQWAALCALIDRSDLATEHRYSTAFRRLMRGDDVDEILAPAFLQRSTDEWAPCLQHVAFGDPVAGVYAATAVLVALAEREVRGGAEIDLSQVECLFQVGADAIIAEQMAGAPLPRTGSARARLDVCCVVPAAGDDNWLAVATATKTLEWLASGNRAPTTPELASWAVDRDGHEAAAELRARGVAAAPVQPTHVLGHDPQLVATGFWETMERAYVGTHTLGAPPFRFDGHRPVARRPAPTLGEHTEQVLGERV